MKGKYNRHKTVDCPFCGAKAGRGCFYLKKNSYGVMPQGYRMALPPHKARVKLAEEKERENENRKVLS